MINDKLKKAREYEVRKEKEIAPDKRPAFHLTPRVGWMNKRCPIFQRRSAP